MPKWLIQYFMWTSSQAPSNMKSVLQAGWLLTVAVGNIIVLIVAEAAKLPDQVGAFYLNISYKILSVLTWEGRF